MPFQDATPQTAVSQGVAVPASPTAAEIYQALSAQRSELIDQREALEDTRQELSRQLRQGTMSEADRAGIDQRIALTDKQIIEKQIAIAEADARVATAAAVPGATLDPTPPRQNPNDEVFEMFGFTLFICTVLAIPIVMAWTRRIWRRGLNTGALPAELTDRLGSLERSVDSVALEVERIGEGQRFVTQLLAERAATAGRLAAAGDDRQV